MPKIIQESPRVILCAGRKMRSTPYGQRGDEEPSKRSGRLKNLGLGRRRQLGAEDAVPEAAGDAEAVLVVGEVVLQVVLLEFAPVGWEAVRRIFC